MVMAAVIQQVKEEWIFLKELEKEVHTSVHGQVLLLDLSAVYHPTPIVHYPKLIFLLHSAQIKLLNVVHATASKQTCAACNAKI